MLGCWTTSGLRAATAGSLAAPHLAPHSDAYKRAFAWHSVPIRQPPPCSAHCLRRPSPMTPIDSDPVGAGIPPTGEIRERLQRLDLEANLLRSQLRLALRRDREVERLREQQARQGGGCRRGD